MRTIFFCLLFSSVAIADEIYKYESNGKEIEVNSNGNGCTAPETRNGIVRIDCSRLDGPRYFFDESTREIISICPFWGCDILKDNEQNQTCKTECPPKQWPIEISDCDNQVVEGILGTWRLESTLTPSGLSRTHGGWSMTIADDSVLFDFQEVVQFKRSYAVVEKDNRYYKLELEDESEEIETINIKLMPCGLMIEPKAVCSAFCKNLHSEFSEEDRRAILSIVAVGFDDSMIEEFIKRSLEESHQQPFFSNHSFFREVITN